MVYCLIGYNSRYAIHHKLVLNYKNSVLLTELML